MSALTLSCQGALEVETIAGTIIARADKGSGSKTQWARARCPICGWKGEITLARSKRRNGLICGSAPGDGRGRL